MAESPAPVSIIIRCFNEERHIAKLLVGIGQQKTDHPIEVVIVDSGSTDRTLEIAQSFASSLRLRLIQITPKEFSFGFALNRGIRESRGAYCVAISAHCFPKNDRWLANLVAPFQDPQVAMVFGKQRGVETTAYSEHQVFAKWFPETSYDDYPVPFANNANSAVRRSAWEKHPFNELLTGLEDIDWAKHAKAKGFKIAYRADAAVAHVHAETSSQVFRRYYREAYSYKAIYPTEAFGLRDFFKFFGMNVVGDSLHAVQERVLLRKLPDILRFRFLQFWATYRAHAYREPISTEMARRLYYPRRPPQLRSKPAPAPQPDPAAARPADPAKAAGPGPSAGTAIIDISRPLKSGIPVWPGAKPFEIQWQKTFESHQVNDSFLSFNTHTGTHLDAPYHFLQDGKRLGELPLDSFIGEAFVVEHLSDRPIDVADLEAARIPAGARRILFKTVNSRSEGEQFRTDFVALTSSAAVWLVERGVVLVGVDGPSVQCFDDKCNDTHTALLSAGIIVLEGLDLSAARGGTYHLVALPLSIPEAEGAPVRAILIDRRPEWHAY